MAEEEVEAAEEAVAEEALAEMSEGALRDRLLLLNDEGLLNLARGDEADAIQRRLEEEHSSPNRWRSDRAGAGGRRARGRRARALRRGTKRARGCDSAGLG